MKGALGLHLDQISVMTLDGTHSQEEHQELSKHVPPLETTAAKTVVQHACALPPKVSQSVSHQREQATKW